MASEDDKKIGWKNRIREQYRLVILEEDTLREVRSLNLNLLNLYILITSIIVVVSTAIVMLIVFTPIKSYIPGYGQVEGNPKFVKLTKNIEELEQSVEEQSIYIDGLMNMLNGVKIDKNIITNTPIAISDGSEDISSVSESTASSKITDIYDMQLIAPVAGTISSGFQHDIKHYGVDVLGAKNTPVMATDDGVVITSDWTIEYGNVITIQHKADLISVYKHNSTLLKNLGDAVKKGESIAIIGNSGTLSSGPHLHFELWYKGIPLNPNDYINFN